MYLIKTFNDDLLTELSFDSLSQMLDIITTVKSEIRRTEGKMSKVSTRK